MAARYQNLYQMSRDRLLNGEAVESGYHTGIRFALRVRDETGEVVCSVNDLGLAIRNNCPGTHWVKFSALSLDDMAWLMEDQKKKNESLRLRADRMAQDIVNMQLAIERKRMHQEMEEFKAKYRG